MVQTRRDVCILDRVKCSYITERYNFKIPLGRSARAYQLSLFQQRMSPIVVLQRLRESDVYHWTSGKRTTRNWTRLTPYRCDESSHDDKTSNSRETDRTDVIADRDLYGNKVGVDGMGIHTAKSISMTNKIIIRKHHIVGKSTTLKCNILTDENNGECRTTSKTSSIVLNLIKEGDTSNSESRYVSICHDKSIDTRKLNHGQHISEKSFHYCESAYDQQKLSALNESTDIFPTALIRNVASDVKQTSIDPYGLSQDEMLHPHNSDPMDSLSVSENANTTLKIDDKEDIRQPKTKLHPTPEDHDDYMKITTSKKRVHPRRMRDYGRYKKLPKMHMLVNTKETSGCSTKHASSTVTSPQKLNSTSIHKKYVEHDFPKRQSLFADTNNKQPDNFKLQEGATLGNVNNSTRVRCCFLYLPNCQSEQN